MRPNKYSPFLLSLICFICGIYYQNFIPQQTIILLVAILLFNTLILVSHKKKVTLNKIQLLIPILFFYSGGYLLQTQKEKNLLLLKQLSKNNIDIISTVESKEENFTGRIKEIVKLHVSEIAHTKYYKKNIQNKQKTNYQSTNFNLLLYFYRKTNLQIDDKIKIKDISIKNPKKNQSNNPFTNYLLKENVLSSLFIKKLKYIKISSKAFSFKRWIQRKKIQIYKQLKTKLSFKTFSFFSPIFLGNKKINIDNNLKNKFNCWGITHYLARSGLHIILFILIWQLFLNLIPIPFKLKRLILFIICFIYLLFSWTSIPFFRAFYIFVLYELGKLFDKQTNFIHLLTTICLLILLTNPIQLLFIDFQLSFALTFALALSGKIILNKTNT